jgi:hypothetical protein
MEGQRTEVPAVPEGKSSGRGAGEGSLLGGSPMKTKHTVPARFWAVTVGAFLTGTLLLLTLIWPDWIELAFGVDPDQHSGSLEATLVVVCAAATLLFGTLANRDWRRARQRVEARP